MVLFLVRHFCLVFCVMNLFNLVVIILFLEDKYLIWFICLHYMNLIAI